MGKTFRRFNKDGDYHNVKRERQRQDDFHSKRQQARVIPDKAPEPEPVVAAAPPRRNTKLDAFKNFKTSK